MTEQRVHRTPSADGTEIAGRVHGQGPPLVLVHGSLEDGDLDWEAMLPLLRERFTCYLPSTRNRGLSGHAEDLSPERRVEDITAFVDSIGEPVRLFGESDGGVLALGAAARTDAVSAVAAYEPMPVMEVLDEGTAARLQATLQRTGAAAAENRLAEAAEIFSAMLTTDGRLAALSSSGYFEHCATHVPTFLDEFDQAAQSEDPSLTSTEVLADMAAPVLLLQGAQDALASFTTAGVDHLADHLGNAEVRPIPDAGHFGVTLRPEPIADEVISFLGAGSSTNRCPDLRSATR